MNVQSIVSGNQQRQEGVRIAGCQLLEGTKTLQEILRVATSFEQTAYYFYTALIPKVSNRVRELVEALAAEEQRHYELFKQLAHSPGIGEQIYKEIRTPANDHRFSDYVMVDDLGESPDDRTLLQYALGREHAAMEQYRDLANCTEPGAVHDLFEFLAGEENGHKHALEKTYYDTVHNGAM